MLVCAQLFTRNRLSSQLTVARRASAMADPVSDVDPEQDDDKADAENEDTSKPNPDRRSQLRLVVLVAVLYLVCQTLVIYFMKNYKSPEEYSDDVNVSRNLTSARVSDLEYLKRFCDHPDMDQDEGEASGRESALLESGNSVKITDDLSVSTHVLNAIEKRVKHSDLWCGIRVTYYVCNSKAGPRNFNNYELNSDESIIVKQCNESVPLSGRITFVDDSLGLDIVIAYSECPDYIRPEKLSTIPYLFMHVMKIVSPLPILSTLAVYFYVPQLQNLQGKIIICRLLSDLVYTTGPWFIEEDVKPNLILVCSCVAGITWTTILCYDLWSAFSDCLPTTGRKENGQKFVYYSLIGWGHPTLFGLVVLLAEFELSKWFHILLVIALYVIYIFLNALNVLFFTFTVKNIQQHNKRNLSLVKKGRQGQTAAKGMNLYFRISALMGITSFVFENVDICMIIFVSYNDIVFRSVLRGFSLLDNMLYFIILVCNKRVLRLLENKWKSKYIN